MNFYENLISTDFFQKTRAFSQFLSDFCKKYTSSSQNEQILLRHLYIFFYALFKTTKFFPKNRSFWLFTKVAFCCIMNEQGVITPCEEIKSTFKMRCLRGINLMIQSSGRVFGSTFSFCPKVLKFAKNLAKNYGKIFKFVV